MPKLGRALPPPPHLGKIQKNTSFFLVSPSLNLHLLYTCIQGNFSNLDCVWKYSQTSSHLIFPLSQLLSQGVCFYLQLCLHLQIEGFNLIACHQYMDKTDQSQSLCSSSSQIFAEPTFYDYERLYLIKSEKMFRSGIRGWICGSSYQKWPSLQPLQCSELLPRVPQSLQILRPAARYKEDGCPHN